MFSPTTRIRKAEGVRLRPMEEWNDRCFVYMPGRGLHLVNLTGLYLLQACDGRTLEALCDDFLDQIRTQRWANRAFELVDAYLEDLWSRGLIEADGAKGPARR